MKVSPKKQLNKLTQGKHYLVLGIEADSFRIIDDTDEPYLYEPADFEIIDPNEPSFWQYEIGKDGERYSYPEEWTKPGFFEDYFDNVASAKKAFVEVLNRKNTL
ncbi:hypothetical protein R50072_28310 [Simiduia litorea]|uniref:hypothetical protein n=1 Tax=Simiduia litorea TaxID=1435348 RepID=UPI0036F27350